VNFSYTGRSSTGAVSGVLEAATAGAAADALMARGVTPLQILQARHAGRPTVRQYYVGFLKALLNWIRLSRGS